MNTQNILCKIHSKIFFTIFELFNKVHFTLIFFMLSLNWNGH
ncbi:hypothetical protein DBT_0136 [Dissulfuribacter thermophilus]|uniref:Uncharacterized protein n=1 Tax=Dissulfuribacter thermophilus TaxID=1156395 RepID=A0A1B9F8R2_9BACT|nr:hypothetical protein DBT_0136 [Dissulfuribacter thermophilus]